jgi:hypothetical protein
MPSNNRSQVAEAIRNFCKSRLQSNPLFFMSDLSRNIANYRDIKVAPASPDRIMRHMRAKGTLRYECINRARSMYKVLAVQ